jgi:hypothetical protein
LRLCANGGLEIGVSASVSENERGLVVRFTF